MIQISFLRIDGLVDGFCLLSIDLTILSEFMSDFLMVFKEAFGRISQVAENSNNASCASNFFHPVWIDVVSIFGTRSIKSLIM